MSEVEQAGLGGAVSLHELVALAARGGLRFLVVAVRQGQPAGWAALACVPGYAYLGWDLSGSGWVALAGAAVPLVACELSMLVSLLLAQAGRGGRLLLVDRSPSGRAFVVAVPGVDDDGERVWQLQNLIGLPAAGVPRLVDRAQRPGAGLIRRTLREAQRSGVGVRLVAADREVARKVYEPAGFVYDSPDQQQRRQPHMHLPPAWRASLVEV